MQQHFAYLLFFSKQCWQKVAQDFAKGQVFSADCHSILWPYLKDPFVISSKVPHFISQCLVSAILAWLMALSLLQGTGVDGKKFAAGCINAVLNGIDLWACLIILESLDGRMRSVWAGMMQESEREKGRFFFYQLGQLYYSYDSISLVQPRRIFRFKLCAFRTSYTLSEKKC